jgi:Rps23 Pro-64 3,4-dihydroxylase Tpa1-like proline 4-hydroxylase
VSDIKGKLAHADDQGNTHMLVQPLDRETLRQQFSNARPYPFVKIENFLDPEFAREVATAYPTFEIATAQGLQFKSVNERKKVQITDIKLFPQAVARLNAVLASAEFLLDLSYITGIPALLADPELVGGGVHVTGPGGRLDVHVDFNYIESRRLHRRLNLLLYLNPVWNDQWGGHIQLWDKDVSACKAAFAPALNRCVIFETSDISFHGVTPVAPAAPFPRQSFATYYYTREAPKHWKGASHSTIFKARPEEKLRGYVFMPAEIVQRRIVQGVQQLKRRAKRLMRTEN